MSRMHFNKGILTHGIASTLIIDTADLPGAPEALRSKIPIEGLEEPARVAEIAVWMVKSRYVHARILGADGENFRP